MRFFFYGTLLDYDVAALVLGRRLPPAAFVPADLPRHTRWRAEGGSYPIVVPDEKGRVPGVIVGGLSRQDVARLSAYEGPGYRIAPLRVWADGGMTTVSVFAPVTDDAALPRANQLKPSRELWDLRVWQRRHKRAFVTRLRHGFSGRPLHSRP